MKTLTYGQLPDREDFSKAFRQECPDGGYEFENDERVGTCRLSEHALWSKVLEVHRMFEDDVTISCQQADDAGVWCAAVLSPLGFEWV